jgi:aspartate/methionine/tyrosine aminotransferase
MICDEVYALSHFGKDNSEDAAGFCSALSLDLDLIGCQRSRVHVVWSMSKDLGCSGLRMVGLKDLYLLGQPLISHN